MTQARAAGGHAMAAARDLQGAARYAAYAAGQTGAVAHVAAHELGAAAYAIKAARAAAPEGEGGEAAGRGECQWQRDVRARPVRPPRLVRGISFGLFRPLRRDGLEVQQPTRRMITAFVGGHHDQPDHQRRSATR
jgi:hypothetical protein